MWEKSRNDRSSIKHGAKSSIFFLGRTLRVIGSNDEIKRRCSSFDDLSGKVNWPPSHHTRIVVPRCTPSSFVRPSLCSGRTHRRDVYLRFVVRVAVRSFLPRFGRFRNWFIARQSMNNSSQPIRSPINLGRKAKWVDGAGEGSPGEGVKRKAALAKPLSLMLQHDERE